MNKIDILNCYLKSKCIKILSRKLSDESSYSTTSHAQSKI